MNAQVITNKDRQLIMHPPYFVGGFIFLRYEVAGEVYRIGQGLSGRGIKFI